jgi:RHS repeat-associated protein
VDALDATGSGQPTDLNGNGSFSDEVAGLGDPAKYPSGSTFWRVAVSHFTPWDCNWPYGPPADAISPNPEAPADVDTQECQDCNQHTGSFVEERSRIFHEDIPIPGTDMTLHYASNRVKGYHYGITVPASGATVPASLDKIIVRVNIAGRTVEQALDPRPNQTAELVWDGLDHLGRPVAGSIPAHISVGFRYQAVYYLAVGGSGGGSAPAFDLPGTIITLNRTRQEIISWKESDIVVSNPTVKGKGDIAEGWTLSAHDSLSPADPFTLYKGDGTINRNSPSIISTVAGSGAGNFGGDGGLAVNARLGAPQDMVLDAAGNLYIADSYNYRVRKVDTSGIITTVAGTGDYWFYGDGGPAVNASLYYAMGVALDAAGNLYIADMYNHRIRKVDTNGIITTVAGNGVRSYGGDGGPAVDAQLNTPYRVAVDAAGSLYIADTYNNRVRKVDTNGIITTVAGNGTWGFSGDGGPAVDAKLRSPLGLAVDSAGNLYIADSGNNRVRKVDTSGIITTVAGNAGYHYNGDGRPAVDASLYGPSGVAVDAAGNLYIADNDNYRIRKVDTSGTITTVTATGAKGYGGDGGLAVNASLQSPQSVAVDAAGNLYIADAGNNRIRKVGPPSTFAAYTSAGDISFTDENGLGYIMSSAGLHKKTIDLNTGVVLREFAYNSDNQLVSISDRFGNETAIERDPDGVPTAIVSPDGVRTGLTVDANNHLTRITYPDQAAYSFEYTDDGLMTAKVEPETNRFEHAFNAQGRLTDARDEEGGHWLFDRTAQENGDIVTTVTTSEGELTSYLDHSESTGAYTSTITDPTGGQTLYSQSGDGLTVSKSLPCGMNLSFKYDVDSEYKFKYVTEMRERTQAALERVTLRSKAYQDTNSDTVKDLITETVTLNGKATTVVTNTLQAKKTITSPLGRTVTALYDPSTLLTTSLSILGLSNTTYGYDAKGRLQSITTGSRQTTFHYDPQGNLDSLTDPLSQTTTYTHDPVGRLTRIDRPGGGSIGFTYDKNGNMTVLTNPATISHGFGYNKVNLNSSYTTPLSGSYGYVYDKDRRLKQVNFPSGKQINNVYANGRLEEIQTPEGTIDLTYLCGTKVGSITKGAERIAYGYDGSLVTSEALSGTLNGSITYGYNSDFNLTSLNYAGGTVTLGYDNDGLLTSAGSYTITRNTGNGLPEAVTGGALSLARSFNGYGEVDGQDFTVGGQGVTSWSLTRDDSGRIRTKTETVAGASSTYAYTYDPMGRLRTVTRDGALIEEYQYDPVTGIRSYEMNSLRGVTGRSYTYSNEDHLLTAGATTYQYSLDGFLTNKTNGTNQTSYVYSSRGELLRVDLPDGRVIEYVHDPLGRRIAKKVNGAITEKYLWQGLTRLLGVYDGSNSLLMRFQYADARMPVAMTKGGATYYLTYDQVGSLRVVADSSGNVVKRIDYDSFGNIIDDSAPLFAVPLGFAGGLHDRDTGLVRFGFRDYDPDVGRWLAKDPILFAGGDIDLYGYVLDDPINLVDPYGLIKWGQVALGTLQAFDAIAMAGVAFGTTVGTASLTGNPLLTALVGIEMLPVVAATIIEGTHAYHNIYEGFKDEKELESQTSPCKW